MKSIAAQVREQKARSPHLYCPSPECLYRTVTRHGFSPCPKHTPRETTVLEIGPLPLPLSDVTAEAVARFIDSATRKGYTVQRDERDGELYVSARKTAARTQPYPVRGLHDRLETPS